MDSKKKFLAPAEITVEILVKKNKRKNTGGIKR